MSLHYTIYWGMIEATSTHSGVSEILMLARSDSLSFTVRLCVLCVELRNLCGKKEFNRKGRRVIAKYAKLVGFFTDQPADKFSNYMKDDVFDFLGVVFEN